MAHFGPLSELDRFLHLGGSLFFALLLQFFELGAVVLALATETGFLERDVAEIFSVGEEDLPFDQRGADGQVGLFGKFFGEFAAADGVDRRFESRDAEEAPLGFGDGVDERFFGVVRRLELREETGDVVVEGLTIVGGEEDGAAGEPGFDGVVRGNGFP